MRTEIRFAGFGGQGIVSAGIITGRAAALHDKKNAVMTQSYGPEARGGACNANVIISDQRITFPEVTTPDLVILMSQEAFTKFGHAIAEDGAMILDEDMVDPQGIPEGIRALRVPATRIAETLGNKIVANVVMLGVLASLGDVVKPEAMLAAVRASVPERFIELNQRAFQAGCDFVKEDAP